jgi:hypothetical protein
MLKSQLESSLHREIDIRANLAAAEMLGDLEKINNMEYQTAD